MQQGEDSLVKAGIYKSGEQRGEGEYSRTVCGLYVWTYNSVLVVDNKDL